MNTLIKTVVLRLTLVTGLLAALVVPATAQTTDQAAETGSYGYFRVVEGAATLTPADGERAAVEINQPLLAGDQLSVPERAHVEIVLADHNLLRVDGGSELVVERQAGETGRDDQATMIRLIEGNVQLAVVQDSLGDQLPRIDTPNAAIYVKNYGIYRLTAQSDGFSQVVVRRGTAEVAAGQDHQTVRADQEAAIESGNDQEAGIDVRQAGAFDSLERWARRLDDEAASALRAADNAGDADGLDDNLRYQAASLASYGSWVNVEGNRYWRPRVEAGWHPYWHGRWAYTPAGLTWIAYEPWGWVPFHYGTWNYLDSYGWVWQPGYVWSPAWVYWYWGPSYVGWCPTGFYTSYYGAQFGGDFGFRSGVYGWAGGDWGLFDRWSFVGSGYFRDGYRAGYARGYWDGRRDLQRYAVPVEHVRGHGLERGVITTDTKPLRPNTWHDQGAVLHALNVRPNGPNGRGTQGRGVGVGGREVPDVTPFIARKPLSTEVVQTVGARGPGHAQDGTPFKPATLGKPGRGGHDTGNGRTWTRAGTTGDAPGNKPESKPGSRPGRVIVDGAKPGRTGRPAEGRPADTNGSAVDNGRPQTWERPAPNADGGAPKPRAGSGAKPDRPTVDNGRPPRTERPADRPATSDDNRRPPADNNKPTWKRPAPESDGASPKPDRSRDSAKPSIERSREPAPTRPERNREPEKPKVERREAERPKVQEKPKAQEKPKEKPPARDN
ncbi:MAG TPA: DUF6600 domain-containing protein [Thermoanaerobaculia bacterium]|nr:DUF6600 domain-containing protein [Thermoanaerobaculia bacterium]